METDEKCIIAIDPGREKCGVAVLTVNRRTLVQKTVSAGKLAAVLKALEIRYQITVFALGSGTTGKMTKKMLEEEFPSMKVVVVDEYRTTDEARKRYWQENPPKGLLRFIPSGMLVPPVPVDDFAAVVIGEKYLTHMKNL